MLSRSIASGNDLDGAIPTRSWPRTCGPGQRQATGFRTDGLVTIRIGRTTLTLEKRGLFALVYPGPEGGRGGVLGAFTLFIWTGILSGLRANTAIFPTCPAGS